MLILPNAQMLRLWLCQVWSVGNLDVLYCEIALTKASFR